MTTTQIAELQEALFTHFNLAKLTNLLTQKSIINQLKNLDAEKAFDAFFKMAKQPLKARSVNDALSHFREFYKIEIQDKALRKAPIIAKYTKEDEFYPDGRRHDEWHLFEVVMITDEIRKDPKKLEEAQQSYWIAAGSLARAFTLFQDLLHYKLIAVDKEKYRNPVDAFEKKYKKPLMQFVGNNLDEYPSEVNFKEVLDFLKDFEKGQPQ